MNPQFDLSIVILTRNSLGVIERLVQSLNEQDFSYSREYIFMDNNSVDGTPAYLKSLDLPNKQVIHVPDGSFSHSGTRMQGARAAKGRLVAFFTDDIVPEGKDFLSQLTRPVRIGEADAAYGVCQIDPKRHDPVDAFLHNSWPDGIADISEPVVDYCWELFTPATRRRICNFDNCASCIRRDLLLEMKFPDVPYGEDMLFAKKMIRSGRRVALARKARFFHWHKVRFSYFLKRMCIDSHLGVQEFGIYYVSRMLGVLKKIMIRVLHRTYIAFFRVKMPLHKKIYWSVYNAKLLSADFIGKYMGALDEDRCKGGFSPLKRRLFRKKEKIIDSIYKRSIHRY